MPMPPQVGHGCIDPPKSREFKGSATVAHPVDPKEPTETAHAARTRVRRPTALGGSPPGHGRLCRVPEPLIVICAGTSWDGVVSPDRLLATELAAHADILWVDPPISAATPDRYRYGASRLGLTPQIKQLTARITRVTPRALPLHTRPGIKSSTAALVRGQARWALRRLNQRPTAVIACNLVDVLRGWDPGVVKVLYGTDDYVAGAGLMGHNAERVAEDERRQLAHADLVVAVSSVLAERWAGLGARRVELIPNGVQTSAYRDLE